MMRIAEALARMILSQTDGYVELGEDKLFYEHGATDYNVTDLAAKIMSYDEVEIRPYCDGRAQGEIYFVSSSGSLDWMPFGWTDDAMAELEDYMVQQAEDKDGSSRE